MTPPIRVIVEPAAQRKGWRWRQVTRNGATGAVSPKNYDSKALAKRAGQRQVDVLNGHVEVLLNIVSDRMTPTETFFFDAPYAVLVVNG